MKLTFNQLKGQLDKLSDIVVIYGEDYYLREKAAEQIEKSLNLDFVDLNKEVLAQAPMEKITDACVTMPFMSGRRLVIAEDYVVPKGRDQKEREIIENYAKNPTLTTMLVFVTETLPSVLDGIANADYVDCKKLDGNTLEKWITVFCRKEGKQISPYDARLLADYCLGDMSRISTETKKLCDFAEGEITKEDIDLMVEKDNEIKLYELANDIANKNCDKAFLSAKNLLDKGVTVSALVSSVYRTFRRMFYSLVSSGTGQKEMASYLGVQPFAVAKAREVAQKFSPVKLKKALEICAEADENIRKNINNNAVINFLILSLINI